MDCGSLLPLSGGQPAGRRAFQGDATPRRSRVCASGEAATVTLRLRRQHGCLGESGSRQPSTTPLPETPKVELKPAPNPEANPAVEVNPYSYSSSILPHRHPPEAPRLTPHALSRTSSRTMSSLLGLTERVCAADHSPGFLGRWGLRVRGTTPLQAQLRQGVTPSWRQDSPVPIPLSSHPGPRASHLPRPLLAGSATRRIQGLTSGDFFASISAFLKNLRFC